VAREGVRVGALRPAFCSPSKHTGSPRGEDRDSASTRNAVLGALGTHFTAKYSTTGTCPAMRSCQTRAACLGGFTNDAEYRDVNQHQYQRRYGHYNRKQRAQLFHQRGAHMQLHTSVAHILCSIQLDFQRHSILYALTPLSSSLTGGAPIGLSLVSRDVRLRSRQTNPVPSWTAQAAKSQSLNRC
jgi:hypothetical protein